MTGNTVRTNRLWVQVAMSLAAAGPVGGFLLGLLNPGDPDPNPVGRLVYACLLAVATPLHAGFPPHDQAGPGQTLNAWPHILVAFLLTFAWFIYRGRVSKAN